jgi:hypothetical protein
MYDITIVLATVIPVCMGVFTVIGCAIRRQCLRDKNSDKYIMVKDDTQIAEMYVVPINPYPALTQARQYPPPCSPEFLEGVESQYTQPFL